MKYTGLQTQIWRNNTRSILLLVLFPFILYALTWVFSLALSTYETENINIDHANSWFIRSFPVITIGVLIWFVIAYFSHTSMIAKATGARPLQRKENKRVYNLVENLCIATGISIPKIYVIDDSSLNAYASGINEKTYTVTLSTGIIDKLDDAELEAVIAHELTHIRNRDVRLLIVSIIFVGIFAFLTEMLFRSMRFGGRIRTSGNKKGSGAILILIGVVLAIIGYYVTLLCRFALSRKREYMADAGAAQMTKNPEALASALRKIKTDPLIEAVKRKDVAQMFIDNPQAKAKKRGGFLFSGLFATHPPIDERIRLLEQF